MTALVRRSIVIRSLPPQRHGRCLCAECGPQGTLTLGTPRIPLDRLVEAEVREQVRQHTMADDLHVAVYGWVCTAHAYRVVMPVECPAGNVPAALEAGWTAVLVAFADQTPRWVAIPTRELEGPAYDRVPSGGDEAVAADGGESV